MKNNNIEYNFQKNLNLSLKKINKKKNKNIYVTSDLSSLSSLRIKKEKKLKIIFDTLKKSAGKNFTIFTPGATLNLCGTNEIFDIKNTKSYKMGPLSEYIRNLNSRRSLHPYWSVVGVGKNSKLLKTVSKHSYGFGSPWSKMLELDTLQINIGMHPSKAVTLIHHIETIMGVPYRFNKEFLHKIRLNNRIIKKRFYMSVMFKASNALKRKKLNEHYFKILEKRKKLNYVLAKPGLKIWSFKMRDFYDIAVEQFINDEFNYLERNPNLDFMKNL